MNWNTFYTLGFPVALGLVFHLNFMFWRLRARKISVSSAFYGWFWFVFGGALGGTIAHLMQPAEFAEIGSNPLEVIGLLVALVTSPLVSAATWGFLRLRVKAVERKEAREKARADRQRAKQEKTSPQEAGLETSKEAS